MTLNMSRDNVCMGTCKILSGGGCSTPGIEYLLYFDYQSDSANLCVTGVCIEVYINVHVILMWYKLLAAACRLRWYCSFNLGRSYSVARAGS